MRTGAKKGRLGGITFIQRIGSHLNVHAHYHGVLAANSPSRKQVTAHAGKRLKSGEALASEENDETNQASQSPICAPARGPSEEVGDHQGAKQSVSPSKTRATLIPSSPRDLIAGSRTAGSARPPGYRGQAAV